MRAEWALKKCVPSLYKAHWDFPCLTQSCAKEAQEMPLLLQCTEKPRSDPLINLSPLYPKADDILTIQQPGKAQSRETHVSSSLPTNATLAHSSVSGKDWDHMTFVSEGSGFKSWLCQLAAILLNSFSLCYLTRKVRRPVSTFMRLRRITQVIFVKVARWVYILSQYLPKTALVACQRSPLFSPCSGHTQEAEVSHSFASPSFWGAGYNRGEESTQSTNSLLLKAFQPKYSTWSNLSNDASTRNPLSQPFPAPYGGLCKRLCDGISSVKSYTQ